jgi:hypothetical protein
LLAYNGGSLAVPIAGVNIPGFSWALGTGVYEFWLDVVVSVTTGANLTLTGSYSGGTVTYSARSLYANPGNGSCSFRTVAGSGSSFSLQSNAAVTGGWGMRLYGYIVTTGAGNFSFSASSSSDNQNFIQAGTIGRVFPG